jgi:transcriptional regulator with XRE-family HTH domain
MSSTTVWIMQRESELSSKSVEQAFAEGMQRARRAAGLTQRALAGRLQREGLTLDPSAITRIEQGKREVKFSEAVLIARVFGTSALELAGVEQLVPQRELVRLRDEANLRMNDARRYLVSMLDTFLTIQELLRKSPSLLEELADERDPAPASVEDYLPWVRERVQRVSHRWMTVVTESGRDAENLRKIARALSSHAVKHDASWEWGPRRLLELRGIGIRELPQDDGAPEAGEPSAIDEPGRSALRARERVRAE